MTVVECYAPMNSADDDDKARVYEELDETIKGVNGHDFIFVLIVGGDLNAKVGSDNIRR